MCLCKGCDGCCVSVCIVRRGAVVVLSGFSKFCFVLSRQKLCVGMVVCISWLHSYLCVWM